jgi:uncharacterized SAM-binding protein YcdF (DUF218 family)
MERLARRTRIARGAGAALGAALLAGVVAAGAEVVRYSERDDSRTADAILVLGTSARDGEPGAVLRARLEHALSLYRDGVAPRVITVGGVGAGETVSEADAGRSWLQRQGVAADAVVAVGTGVNTLTSMRAVRDELRGRGWDDVVVVTDPSHHARVRHMASGLGIEATGSPTQSGRGSALTPWSLVRETLGLVEWTVVERPRMLLDAVLH